MFVLNEYAQALDTKYVDHYFFLMGPVLDKD